MNKIDWTKPLISGPDAYKEAARFTGGMTEDGRYIVQKGGGLCRLDEYGRDLNSRQIVLNAPEPPQAKPYTFDTFVAAVLGKVVWVRQAEQLELRPIQSVLPDGAWIGDGFYYWAEAAAKLEISINGSPWRPCRDEGTGI